jgi:hypothetical protein
MWERVTRWVERRITTISQFLVVGVFVLWALSAILQPLADFLSDSSFYNVVTLVLLFEIVRRVVEIKLDTNSGGVQAFRDQEAADPVVNEAIAELRPATVDMLEYSGMWAKHILEEVFRARPKARVRLLLHHSTINVLNEFETIAINQSLDWLRRHMAGRQIEVRLYTTPAGLRGRSYAGQLVSLTWYTYQFGDGETEIRGHTNAMVVARTNTPQGEVLLTTFDNAFTRLWEHRDTERWSAQAPPPTTAP